jgi:hypothetical protein
MNEQVIINRMVAILWGMPDPGYPCPQPGCEKGKVIVNIDSGYGMSTQQKMDCQTCKGKGKIFPLLPPRGSFMGGQQPCAPST